MKKKLFSIFLLMIFSVALIACGGDNTTADKTTENQTTEEQTSDEQTTSELTTDETTTSETTTGDEVTTDGPTTNTPPKFVGLFTSQTYYIGSQSYENDSDFILNGVQAIDDEDGDISDQINLAGAFTLKRTGSYEVFVYVTDSDGNTNNVKVTITVKKLTAYEIPEEFTSDDVTIELWHSNGATIETALNNYAEDFMELYPNVTVKITKSGNNYDELRQNVINAIRGGELPNIVQNYPDHVMEYIDNGAVIPLTPYIYDVNWGYNPAVEEESFLDILLSYRRENSQYTSDGEYYSLPFNKSTEVMIYNKTIMDALIEEGVITEVPTTWQGLFAIADDMRRVAVEGGIIDDVIDILNTSDSESVHKSAEERQSIKDNFVPIAYDSPANAFITLTRQWGGKYTGVSADGEGLILFDNPQTREALSYFFDNRDSDDAAGAFTIPGRWGTEYASDAFKVAQTAVTFGSTGGARYNTPTIVNDQLAFEFGVAPMPYNADLPENRTAIQQGTNMSITTAGTDQEKLASWLFLKFLTSKDIQLDFALETGYSPIRSSVYDEPSYINFTSGLDQDGNPLAGEMLMKSQAARAAAEQSSYLFYDQAFVGSSDARAAVEDAFGRVILGTDGDKASIIDNAIASAKSTAEQVLN